MPSFEEFGFKLGPSLIDKDRLFPTPIGKKGVPKLLKVRHMSRFEIILPWLTKGGFDIKFSTCVWPPHVIIEIHIRLGVLTLRVSMKLHAYFIYGRQVLFVYF